MKYPKFYRQNASGTEPGGELKFSLVGDVLAAAKAVVVMFDEACEANSMVPVQTPPSVKHAISELRIAIQAEEITHPPVAQGVLAHFANSRGYNLKELVRAGPVSFEVSSLRRQAAYEAVVECGCPVADVAYLLHRSTQEIEHWVAVEQHRRGPGGG